MVETCPLHPPTPTPTPTPEAEKRNASQKGEKQSTSVFAKIAVKKKKCNEKMARLLCDLKTYDLHMKHLNSSANIFSCLLVL